MAIHVSNGRPGAGHVRLAQWVFLIAGLWGLLVVSPLYFMRDFIGRSYPPSVAHPDIYYGFVGVTLVWQLAFLVIATDPARYRPMMPIAMLEKFIYVATLCTLVVQHQIQPAQAAVMIPDLILGILFVAAYRRTPRARFAAMD